MLKGVLLHRDPVRHRTTSSCSTDSSTRIQAQRTSFAPSLDPDLSGLDREVYPPCHITMASHAHGDHPQPSTMAKGATVA